MVQLLAPYIDHESHSAQRYSQTDRQTDVTLMPIADLTVWQYDRLKSKLQKISKLYKLWSWEIKAL